MSERFRGDVPPQEQKNQGGFDDEVGPVSAEEKEESKKRRKEGVKPDKWRPYSKEQQDVMTEYGEAATAQYRAEKKLEELGIRFAPDGRFERISESENMEAGKLTEEKRLIYDEFAQDSKTFGILKAILPEQTYYEFLQRAEKNDQPPMTLLADMIKKCL